MVFQFNQSLIRFFYTVKLWYLEHQHIKYHDYVEISVIFLCILTSDSISWIYECFEVSSLFHWVWDNMIYTILSLYYTYLKKGVCAVWYLEILLFQKLGSVPVVGVTCASCGAPSLKDLKFPVSIASSHVDIFT